ncbi:MAG: hypothetical protein PHV07_03810 [Oscillospiraceae bacterium]|nr:hypothetical protein [Oscillospiraceae bacterium]
MKKFFTILLSILAITILVSCTASQDTKITEIENVSMTIQEGSITPTGLTVIITDKNNPTYQYGEWYEIEKSENGAWVDIPAVVKGDYGFNLIAYNTIGNKLKLDVDWEWLYGTLDKGEYRMLKNLYIDGENIYFNAEFNIE